jgi:hypothetical protein
MNDSDTDRAEAIRVIADSLADAYLAPSRARAPRFSRHQHQQQKSDPDPAESSWFWSIGLNSEQDRANGRAYPFCRKGRMIVTELVPATCFL